MIKKNQPPESPGEKAARKNQRDLEDDPERTQKVNRAWIAAAKYLAKERRKK